MKKKKGFTLVELAVAIAVSAITMTMLFTVVLSINAFIKTKEKFASYQNDLLFFKNDITSIFEEYQEVDYLLVADNSTNNKILFQDNEIYYEISFSNNALFNNGTKINEYDNISKVCFECKDNLIKCVACCDDEFKYTIILDKRV